MRSTSTTGIVSRRRRSEEHTSGLQSPCNLVCRLLLEKKKGAADGDADNQIPRQRAARASTCSATRRLARMSRRTDALFFNGTATTLICTVSLHDALPI